MKKTIFDKINFSSDNISLIQDDRKISYRQLKELINQTKNYLKQVNAKRVAAVLDNSIEWVLIDLACQMTNIVFIPLPPFFSQEQIQHALTVTATDTLFVHDINRDKPIQLNKDESFEGFTSSNKKCNFKNIKCLQHQLNTWVELPKNTVKITFTSGSTGTPKGVCLSIENQISVAQSLVETIAIERPRHLCLLPLSTLLENIAGVYAPLICGGSIILVSGEKRGLMGSSKLNAKQLLSTISINQPDSLILVPELLFVLVSAAEQGWPAPASLKFIAVGGSKVCTDLLDRAATVRLPVYQGYGLSECASVVCLCSPQDNRLGSVGRPLSHIKLSFEHDEIIIKGNSFLGYLGDKKSWYPHQVRSGDLGRVEDNGQCFISGRIKNLIVTSFGRNISPEWIEAECLQKRIMSQSLLQQCVVFGDAKPFCIALIHPFEPDIKAGSVARFIMQINEMLPDYAQIKNWLILKQPLSEKLGLMTENNRPKRLAIQQYFTKEIEQLSQSHHPYFMLNINTPILQPEQESPQ